MSNYAFLRSNAAMIVVGVLLGLVGGFKIANSQYRSQQSAALKQDIARATSGMPSQSSQAEINAIIEKARSNPNDVEAQINAAFQFIQIERFQDAMPFLEQARTIDSNDRRVSAGLGLVYFMMGQYEQAITQLKLSREQGVDNANVLSLLAGAYIRTGKNLDEAERLLNDLEKEKVEPTMIAQMRSELNAAKNGTSPSANQGGAPDQQKAVDQKARTSISHGPEQPKIAK